MMNVVVFYIVSLMQLLTSPAPAPAIQAEQEQFHLPVLTQKPYNSVLRLKITVPEGSTTTLHGLTIHLAGTDYLQDIHSVAVLYTGSDSVMNAGIDPAIVIFGQVPNPTQTATVTGNRELAGGTHYFWVSYRLYEQADLHGRIGSTCTQLLFGNQQVAPDRVGAPVRQRVGVAVRQQGEDGVHTSRIPGLATTKNGTLLAVFDARYESNRDLQGHMDIGLHRSTDGGQTWEPLQVAIDMGEWGGLPQRYNGVSDACILVDTHSDDIYIAGLWMHGVLDDDGQWVEGLHANSTAWNHQWRDKGSQPGFGVKQTAQFLIVKSTDDGQTWSDPVNITRQGKEEGWWLWAPAPGRGITLTDGTLVFPTEGRDRMGKSFSNITYSKDGGKTWRASEPALDIPEGTTECAVVELSDGRLMLNMRSNRNWDNLGPENGRVIAVTSDLGETWTEHSTSRHALPESGCMASLYSHTHQCGGHKQRFLLFTNPHSKIARDHMTLKVSDDDGNSWPSDRWVLLDEWDGNGYSCITETSDGHIGVLYESSQAQLVFQKIPIEEIVKIVPGNALHCALATGK